MWLGIMLVWLLQACSTLPPDENLGVKNFSGPERIPQTVMMLAPPLRVEARGYAINIPAEWMKKQVVCRVFPTSDGRSIPVCRKASRAILFYANGSQDQVSALIYDNRYVIFGRQAVSGVTILSADGEEWHINSDELVRLSETEVDGLYRMVAEDFPFISQPITNTDIRMLYGREALEILPVPSLLTRYEQAAYCGLFSASTTEALGVITANPLTALPKLWSVVCFADQEPFLLMSKPQEE
jgi:hypothetical protein